MTTLFKIYQSRNQSLQRRRSSFFERVFFRKILILRQKEFRHICPKYFVLMLGCSTKYHLKFKCHLNVYLAYFDYLAKNDIEVDDFYNDRITKKLKDRVWKWRDTYLSSSSCILHLFQTLNLNTLTVKLDIAVISILWNVVYWLMYCSN